MALKQENLYLQPQKKFLCRLKNKLQYKVALHPANVWKRFVDELYSIVKRTLLENFSLHINNLHRNITFAIEGKEMENQRFLIIT